jgi:outer membrane lipoprotein-sorting protein
VFKKVFILIVSLFVFSGSALAFEFSADMIMTHKGMGKTTSKIYYKKDRFRMDMKAPEEMITITRLDKKVVWNIMPDQKMYMELPFTIENKPMVEEKFEGEIDRKYLGSETIDGHPAKKYLITYKIDNKKEQVYQWWATDINFPIKTASADGSWVQEYKNIKMGSQQNSLFELPKGYKKFQMPAGMNMMRMKTK